MKKTNKVEDVKKTSRFSSLNPKGLWHLLSVVAESMGAYILWFSGNTPSLKVVAAILIVDAAVKAMSYFVVK